MKVLSHKNLIALIRPICGFSTRIALCNLIDEDGEVRTCYVKAFVPGSRGIVGELVGWLLAEACQLKQPRAAWIQLVKPQFLTELWPEINWGTRDVICWATLQLDCPSPETLTTRISARTRQQLRQWRGVPIAIALTEWLANVDANGSNLLRISPTEWAMIDWAESFGGQFWRISDLHNLEFVYNKLAHLTGYIRDQLYIDQDDARQIMQAAAKQRAALLACDSTLYEWLNDLIGSRKAREILDFLETRAGLENSRWNAAATAMA